jgi:hypothetical protein
MYDHCIKAPAGRHKKIAQIFQPNAKKINTATNGEYFQPFEQQLNLRSKLNP